MPDTPVHPHPRLPSSRSVIAAVEQAAGLLARHDKPGAQRALLAAEPNVSWLRAVLMRTEAEFREAQAAELDRLFGIEAQLATAEASCAALRTAIEAAEPQIRRDEAELATIEREVHGLRDKWRDAEDQASRVRAQIEETDRMREVLDTWWARIFGLVLKGFGLIRSLPQIISALGQLQKRQAEWNAAVLTYMQQLSARSADQRARQESLAPREALLRQMTAQKSELDALAESLRTALGALRAEADDIRRRLRFFTDVRLFYVKLHHILEVPRFVEQRIHHVVEVLEDLDSPRSATLDFRNPRGPQVPLRQALAQFDGFLADGLIPTPEPRPAPPA